MKLGQKVQMRGGRLYASIYCALPGTCREVAEKLNLKPEPVENALRSMKALGLVHRSKIVPIGDRRVPAGFYERGEGVNAQYPRAGLIHSRPRAGAIAFRSVIQAFEAGAAIYEVVEATGCAATYVRLVVNTFRSAGMAHIACWKTETKYQRAPVWKLTEGADMPKPKPVARKTINQQYLVRKKQRLAAELVTQSFARMGDLRLIQAIAA